ncbi:MAG TPA: C-type lectin domain-containing protein [bacterium]|nr:C-type lectin domain-containing protein [bacterium]
MNRILFFLGACALALSACTPSEEAVYCETAFDCPEGWECGPENVCIESGEQNDNSGGTDQTLPEQDTLPADESVPPIDDALPGDTDLPPADQDNAVTDDGTGATDDDTVIIDNDELITDEDSLIINDDSLADDEDILIVDDTMTPDNDTVLPDETSDADADVSLDCGADWTLNNTTGTCYRYFADTKDFDTAESDCVTLQGHLVSIASVDENDWVRDNIGIPADTAYWLGYTAADATGPGTGSANGNTCASPHVVNSSGGTYSFSTTSASATGCLCGSSTVSGNFVSFRLNSPSTGYWEIVADTSNDAVITIHEDPGCSSCTADRVACVDSLSGAGKEVFNNQYQLNSSHWYLIMIAGKTSDVTGTLYIRPPITASNFADHYSWTDGDNHSYANWLSTQPDYASGNERCAHVWGLTSETTWGQWNDNQCSALLPYVCERLP